MMYSLKKKHQRTYESSAKFTGYEDLQYKLSDPPDTEKKWNQCLFVEKTHFGCTYWPKYVILLITAGIVCSN